MPAPTPSAIELFLTQSLITQGLTKKIFDANGNAIDTGVLTDEMQKIVKGLAQGISNTWQAWQTAEIAKVTIPVTAAQGLPSVGTAILP